MTKQLDMFAGAESTEVGRYRITDIGYGDGAPKERHQIAACYPDMTEQEFTWLRDSVAEIGLLYPITLFEGQVLDGWHRELACRATGVRAQYQTLEGSRMDAVRFTVSANVTRQHLTHGQRAMIAAKMSTP